MNDDNPPGHRDRGPARDGSPARDRAPALDRGRTRDGGPARVRGPALDRGRARDRAPARVRAPALDGGPARDRAPARRSQDQYGLRLLALLTVIAGVVAAAAAAFVFSYPGVHDIARTAGMQAGLARFYPALPDAVLVMAVAAALVLGAARWWVRLLAWLSIVALVALVGAADAVHAMAIKPPRRPTEAAVAVLPWVLLLLGFRLWCAVLRHARTSQAPPAAGTVAAEPVLASPAVASPAVASPAADSAVLMPVEAADPAAGGAPGSQADASQSRADSTYANSADGSPAERHSVDASPANGSPADLSPAAGNPAVASPADTSQADLNPAAGNPAVASPADTIQADLKPAAGNLAGDSAADGILAAHEQAPGEPIPGSTGTGVMSSPATFRGLDLILAPYPDEPEHKTADDALPERATDQELADQAEADREQASAGPPEGATDPGPELAIDADPPPDDPASDESHGIGDEMTEDEPQLISGSPAGGRLSAFAAREAAAEAEPGYAFPATPLSAPVPETAGLQRGGRASAASAEQSPHSESRPLGPDVPPLGAAQPVPAHGTRDPHSVEPEAPGPEPLADEPRVGQAPQPAAPKPNPDAQDRETRQGEAAQSPTANEVTANEVTANELTANEPDVAERATAERAGEFPRVRSSPVPPETERRADAGAKWLDHKPRPDRT